MLSVIDRPRIGVTNLGGRSCRRSTACLHSRELLELLELFLNSPRSARGTHQGRDGIEVDLDFMDRENGEEQLRVGLAYA